MQGENSDKIKKYMVVLLSTSIYFFVIIYLSVTS